MPLVPRQGPPPLPPPRVDGRPEPPSSPPYLPPAPAQQQQQQQADAGASTPVEAWTGGWAAQPQAGPVRHGDDRDDDGALPRQAGDLGGVDARPGTRAPEGQGWLAVRRSGSLSPGGRAVA